MLAVNRLTHLPATSKAGCGSTSPRKDLGMRAMRRVAGGCLGGDGAGPALVREAAGEQRRRAGLRFMMAALVFEA